MLPDDVPRNINRCKEGIENTLDKTNSKKIWIQNNVDVQ